MRRHHLAILVLAWAQVTFACAGEEATPDTLPGSDTAIPVADTQHPLDSHHADTQIVAPDSGSEDTSVIPEVSPDTFDGEAEVSADTAPPPVDTVSETSEPPGDTTASDDVGMDEGLTDTACTPQCEDKTCGDDGCGDVCGICDDGNACTSETCDAGNCVYQEAALVPCDDPPCVANNACLYAIARDALSPAERLMVLSLQGILAQQRSGIWLTGYGAKVYVDDLETNAGLILVKKTDPWELLGRFEATLAGYVLFDVGENSQSVAMSLAGVWGAVAIGASLEGLAVAAGLPLLADVRGKDEKWCWDNHGDEFNLSLLVEQSQDEPFTGFLYDYAVANKAFVYFDEACDGFRTTLAQQMDDPVIVGWGQACGEYEFVLEAALGDAPVVPADWSSNLSVLSRIQGMNLDGNNHASPDLVTQEGVHYVAFVMSDGDNIQFIQNTFPDPPWWGSVHRGAFPMTWEMSPLLADMAPSLLGWLYATATPNDQMIAGPSGAGYTFPSVLPNLQTFAETTAAAMAATDMRVVLLLDDGGGLEAGDLFTAQPEIDGVLYKSFADYNAMAGKLRWSNGKPILGVTHLLWNNGSVEDSPAGVAAALNAAPSSPKTDPGSYSVVNVHAWSEWPENPEGDWAMDAVKWTVSQLDDHVKIVSVEELLAHMKKNLEGQIGPGGWVFEAETDLLHKMGYPEGEGWACNTADHAPDHMCYGPYTEAVPVGPHTVELVMMIDQPFGADDTVVTLDVYDAISDKILAIKDVSRKDFAQAFTYQTFALPFETVGPTKLEFRVFWHDKAYINVDKVTVY